MSETLWALVRIFVPLSLVSFGGARTILPDIEHQAIAHHWVTHTDFVEIFAIARAAPGPGTTMVTLRRLEGRGVARRARRIGGDLCSRRSHAFICSYALASARRLAMAPENRACLRPDLDRTDPGGSCRGTQRDRGRRSGLCPCRGCRGGPAVAPSSSAASVVRRRGRLRARVPGVVSAGFVSPPDEPGFPFVLQKCR